MTARAPARGARVTDELDAVIAETEARTFVIWRGEQVPLALVPQRIAGLSTRHARELLYASYVEALEALNPIYQQRLAAWTADGDPAKRIDPDPIAFAASLERFAAYAETPYYAALRRYLALIGIEQGDGTEADLWHVLRGISWSHWFGEREVARALAAVGRTPDLEAEGLDGWRAAERRLAGEPAAADAVVAAAIGNAYASLVGSPAWLIDELGVDAEAAGEFVDFVTLVRLWRIRRAWALLTYEQRLYDGENDPALQRAYYAGIVGHLTGVAVAEAGYLTWLVRPYASATDLRVAILGGMLVERFENEHGDRWWRAPASADLVSRIAESTSVEDAVARLGYDGLDWRPVLRQIRTRLIGEMSGYGGPNITTRAGTRKV